MYLDNHARTSISSRIIVLAVLVAVAGSLPSAVFALGPLGPGDTAPTLVGTAPGDPENYRVALSGVTLINFWGVWCIPCREEMPALQAIWEKRKDDGLKVIGVIANNRSTKEEIDAYLKDMAVDYEILLLGKNWSEPWSDIVYYPTSFLVDENGIIVRRYTGALPEQIVGMIDDINAVLDGQPMKPQVIISYEETDRTKK